MAHAPTVGSEDSRTGPSLLRLTLVALIAALAFDAVSTALAWNVVRDLSGTTKHGPIHAVRQTDVRVPASPDGDTSAH
jgi:hypothetical protein